LLTLMVEVKSVPASVVRRQLDAQLQQIESSTGRKPGKKEKRDLSEDIRRSLLPQAFSKTYKTQLWFDPGTGFLYADASAAAKADEVITELVKAVPGLVLMPLHTHLTAGTAMAQWLATQQAPKGFFIGSDCELKASDESGAVVRYARHSLHRPELQQHISEGKIPSKLSLSWNDRIEFQLTDKLQLKKIKFQNIVFENQTSQLNSDVKEDAYDADALLLTHEMRLLTADLIEALGGLASME
jgi:recombination associated protein RdgC